MIVGIHFTIVLEIENLKALENDSLLPEVPKEDGNYPVHDFLINTVVFREDREADNGMDKATLFYPVVVEAGKGFAVT
jgi:hypothetical protein